MLRFDQLIWGNYLFHIVPYSPSYIVNETKKADKKEDKKTIAKDETLITEKIDDLNNLVYKLYELTYDEVKVIEPEFVLSKKEYEAIKLE